MGRHVQSQKKVLYTVRCPRDGVQYLRATGLHVLIRRGMTDNSVTFFCPQCSEQRWMLVNKSLTDELIDGAGVSWTLLNIPLEALEPKFAGPLTQRWLEESVRSMEREDWPRL